MEYSIMDSYLEDISKYPLLTPEEEKECFEKIKLLDSLTMIEIKQVSSYRLIELDLDKLLNELKDKDQVYETVIKSLLPLYRVSENNRIKEIYTVLRKYLKKANSLNRPLTIEEIKEIYDIKYDYLPIMTEKELLKEIENYIIYKNAENKLYCSNLRLVVSIAKKYKGLNECELYDAIQEGNFGLLKAIEKFDLNLDNKFSTYAPWWIKSTMERNMRKYKSDLCKPNNVENEISQLKKILYEMEQELNRKPTYDELAQRMNVSKDKIKLLYESMNSDFISIEQPINNTSDNDDFKVADIIEDKTVNFEQEIENKILVENIQEMLDLLKPKERDVIVRRYGLGIEDNETMTLKELADEEGVTVEAIRIRERRALRKLRWNFMRLENRENDGSK